jgi:NhaP-type Na+/H+ or K+/H+ antiporter
MSALLIAAESSEIEVTETLIVGVTLIAALVGIAVMSVLAIFKEHGVGSGLRTLMEGESIFNDANRRRDRSGALPRSRTRHHPPPRRR